jgi:hypothetical protein
VSDGLSCTLYIYTEISIGLRGKMTAFHQAYKEMIQDLTGNRVPGTEIQWSLSSASFDARLN